MADSAETYVAGPEDMARLAEVAALLAAHGPAGQEGAPPCFLAGAGPGERVQLPEQVRRALEQVVGALRQGLAVTVAPGAALLTTQQAADLLGVSRPTVVRATAAGLLPFQMVGTHRRIALDDVLAHRRQRREEQYAAVEATAGGYDADGQEAEAARAELRAARRAVAASRRAGRGPATAAC